MPQYQLGKVLLQLNSEKPDPRLLEEAVSVLRFARNYFPAERPRSLWPQACNFLADALCQLGCQNGDDALLQEGLDVCEDLLNRYQPNDRPIERIEAQHNVTSLLVALGEREAGSDTLFRALSHCRSLLKAPPPTWTESDSEDLRRDMSGVLEDLGERNNNPEYFDEAIRILRAEIGYSEAAEPEWLSYLQGRLGRALTRCDAGEAGTETLLEAEVVLRASLQLLERTGVTDFSRAAILDELGHALYLLDEREGNIVRLEESVLLFREVLQILAQDSLRAVRNETAETSGKLGAALGLLGDRQGNIDFLEEAVALQCRSRDLYEEIGARYHSHQAEQRLAAAEKMVQRWRDTKDS